MAENSRKAELLLVIKEAGAKETAAEIQKLGAATKTVQGELAKISRADQIQRIGTEMGLLAKKTRDTAAAAKELSKSLASIGANKDEIAAATGAFQAAQTGGTNRLARAGSELRALPSTQTGLGFGTDAIGNVLRLSGALTEIAGKSALTTKAIGVLTPLLGAQAAATTAAALPIAGFLIGFVAIAAALKTLTDATSQSVDRINTFAESQRTLSDKIAGGLTSEQAQKELEELNTRRKLETDTLNTLQAAYDKSTQQLKQATIGGVGLGNAFDNVSKIFSQDEQALADQIEKSKKVFQETQGDYDALTASLEDGSLAANDAAQAEKQLAEERSKSALSAADSAAKELQAQQKALAATEEQNQKRLTSIEDEKDVVQKQIDVLTESGVTSEDVTAKIAALKEQLGLLGKESDFISSTALEASRAADAEKQAKKDAEDASKKAQQAQESYTKAVESANISFKQATEDSGTRLRYALIDNAEKSNRDLLALQTKYQQDESDLQLKSNRSERNAYLDQLDDLENIRDEAAKDQAKALEEGDFKALFQARQKGEEALKQEEKDEARDKVRRQLAASDAIEDLKTADQRQRDAKLGSYRYADIDARNAQTRELAQARLAQNRALAQASASMNAELGLRQQFWNATLKQAQAAINQINGAGASTRGANATSPFGAFQSQFKAVMKR
jgi:hypothetical protein